MIIKKRNIAINIFDKCNTFETYNSVLRNF